MDRWEFPRLRGFDGRPPEGGTPNHVLFVFQQSSNPPNDPGFPSFATFSTLSVPLRVQVATKAISPRTDT